MLALISCRLWMQHTLANMVAFNVLTISFGLLHELLYVLVMVRFAPADHTYG